jgi:hypothetical protein
VEQLDRDRLRRAQIAGLLDDTGAAFAYLAHQLEAIRAEADIIRFDYILQLRGQQLLGSDALALIGLPRRSDGLDTRSRFRGLVVDRALHEITQA